MDGDIGSVILGTVAGLTAAVLFVLGLLGGFCALFGLPKLRLTSRERRVVRSLDELVGERTVFLPPDTPRGPIDQLAGGTSRAAGS